MQSKIQNALHQLGIGLFTCKSSYDKPNAQQNLAGRTHYADADTLRYFKSRILRGYDRHNGLLFVVIESVGSKPYDTKRNKRAVVFDVFGTVVNDRDEWFATSAQAIKAASEFIETFNAEAWTVTELELRAAAMVRDAGRIIDALEGQEAA
jgi:hypothetical protein